MFDNKGFRRLPYGILFRSLWNFSFFNIGALSHFRRNRRWFDISLSGKQVVVKYSGLLHQKILLNQYLKYLDTLNL
jgi:hypothetical protein